MHIIIGAHRKGTGVRWLAGLVQFRHPFDLGGAYFLFNCLVSWLSVFVSAYLYSKHSVPSAGDALAVVFNGTMPNTTSSAISTPLNHTVANIMDAHVLAAILSAANYTSANATTVGVIVSKIDPHTLVAFVGTLFAVWAIAVIGLFLTIKPEYRRTFWSAQTGSAYAQSYFLDHDGNDGRRILIFCHNERQWRAIRDRVKQWALSMYATWRSLQPAWFTDGIRALIPDSFIPAAALRQENARAGGRRSSLANAGVLRRVSLALGASEFNADARAHTASEIAAPSPPPIASVGAPAEAFDCPSTAAQAAVVDIESDGP